MEGLDVAVLEADLLEVVQSQGAENVLWKLLDVVSIHDENLHIKDLIKKYYVPDNFLLNLHYFPQFSKHFKSISEF